MQPNQNQPSPNATPAQSVSSAPTPTQNENPSSTQATILISELRDSMVIMKDGSFRAVIACKSINFDLMSETEREGVEYSYQNFLNSLNFTTQILIRSQRVDIGPYIATLSEIRKNNALQLTPKRLSSKPRTFLNHSVKVKLPKSRVSTAPLTIKPLPKSIIALMPLFLAFSKLVSTLFASILRNSASSITTSITQTLLSANHLVTSIK